MTKVMATEVHPTRFAPAHTQLELEVTPRGLVARRGYWTARDSLAAQIRPYFAQHPLTEAKRRLRDGDWYEDTERLLREAYAPVLDDWLAREATQTSDVDLADLTHAWPFAPPYRNLHHADDQHHVEGLRKALADTDGRKAVVEGILDRLSAERSRLPVDDICTWVRGFGEVK